MSAHERWSIHTIAILHLLLLFPAALFLSAVVVRHLPLLQGAQGIVLLYSGQVWTLWVLLLALPLCVLVTGSTTLRRRGHRDVWSLSLMPVAATTLTAAVILAVVVLHMLAN